VGEHLFDQFGVSLNIAVVNGLALSFVGLTGLVGVGSAYFSEDDDGVFAHYFPPVRINSFF